MRHMTLVFQWNCYFENVLFLDKTVKNLSFLIYVFQKNPHAFYSHGKFAFKYLNFIQ